LVERLCQETGQRIGIEGVQVGCKEHIKKQKGTLVLLVGAPQVKKTSTPAR
jgi:hypothetical protein